MKVIQSATATNQAESNFQDLFQVLEDVNIWHIAGGSVWSVGSQNQNSGSHQGRHDTGGYVPTT